MRTSAALGGDAPGIEVLGDGVVAVAGLAETDHMENPLLFDWVVGEAPDGDAFGGDFAGGFGGEAVGLSAAEFAAGTFVIEVILDLFLDHIAL